MRQRNINDDVTLSYLLRKTSGDADAKIKALGDSLNSRIDGIDSIISDIQDDISGLDGEIDGLDSRIDVLEKDVVTVSIASYSGSQVRVPSSGTNAAITADHEVIRCLKGSPEKQTADWTVTTYDGYLTLSGSASGATSVKLWLAKVRTTI